VAIKGICATVPRSFVETDSYESKFGASTVKKFKKVVGILKRPIALPEQTASDLCFVAANRIIEHLGWDRASIDALVLVTQTPDYFLPASACVLQYRLGLSEECMAFDINLGCSGYVYGMFVASSLINSGVKRVLLLTGDVLNTKKSDDDKSIAMLFGDAGTATALEAESYKKMNFLLRTDGSGFKHFIIPSGGSRNPNGSHEIAEWGEGIKRNDFHIYMNGAEVFNFSVDKPVKAHFDFLNKFNLNIVDFDMFVFHQANKFIINGIAQRIDIPSEKVPISIDRFGNTNSATIPLTIADACAGIPDRNIKILLNGFGVGLSWGVMNTEINTRVCLPIVYTDDYYKEGALLHV
jgi:3-oxoacyl-[acyl-carrier-protein] synthase-3